MKILLPTCLLLLIAVLLLGIKVLFVKGGRFPQGHVSDIPALKKKGIGCASKQ